MGKNPASRQALGYEATAYTDWLTAQTEGLPGQGWPARQDKTVPDSVASLPACWLRCRIARPGAGARLSV